MTVTRCAIDFPPLADAARSALASFETSLLSDAMGGRQTVAAAIKPIKPGLRLVGQARTVFCPGAVRAAVCAIALGRAGEVLVIDGGGGQAHASLGGIMALDARRRGLAGAVIDGAVRDAAELRGMGFPIFCRAVTPHGAGAEPGGEIDSPVRLGGVWVRPGDAVVGDDDGVVVVPLAELDEVIAKAEAKREAEAGWIAAIESGRSLAEVHGFDIPEPSGRAG
jgi:regulator of RNase E activity RraA